MIPTLWRRDRAGIPPRFGRGSDPRRIPTQRASEGPIPGPAPVPPIPSLRVGFVCGSAQPARYRCDRLMKRPRRVSALITSLRPLPDRPAQPGHAPARRPRPTERPGRRAGSLRPPCPADRGDAARGRAVFEDAKGAGCNRCHRVRGSGGEVGPDLSNIGGKYAREHLIESVLEPSRQIVEGYRPTILALEDGRVLTGLVKSETADRLTLVDAESPRRSSPGRRSRSAKFAETSRSCPRGCRSSCRATSSPT